MGHVRDAMRKFESEQPEPEKGKENGKEAEEASGSTGPSAVYRAVQQSSRERPRSRPHGGERLSAGVGGSSCGAAADGGKSVVSAVAAGMESAAGERGGGVAVAVEPRFAETAVVQRERGSMISEQYRIMRTNLLAKFEGGRFCVMVTSAEAGEGKSVTTVNLALALAELQEGRALVVDCDLRKGRLGKLAGVEQSPGVTEILHGRAALRDCIRGTGVANLDVLPAGSIAPDEVGELLGRPELAELICALRRQYEFVLVDTPPVNMVSDVGMIGRCASEALMVVRMNRTSRESVNKAMRLLRAVNVNIAGLALTHQKYFIPGYLYKYS